ncbi:uncharacterized protein Bfra_011393 [Botrytis fragariae]|uniref:Uncharacterized protein n=1 Tax=Botrytis fragariae TaxID=1964551 RepID=A0A8H6AXY4_9HELO|nr:uncharacterized protein Bfra_011393 [Botrytis fragariae]KAF5875631.1 hypothetical protein Bfra_011393 [Botrytis fragariae]
MPHAVVECFDLPYSGIFWHGLTYVQWLVARVVRTGVLLVVPDDLCGGSVACVKSKRRQTSIIRIIYCGLRGTNLSRKSNCTPSNQKEDLRQFWNLFLVECENAQMLNTGPSVQAPVCPATNGFWNIGHHQAKDMLHSEIL